MIIEFFNHEFNRAAFPFAEFQPLSLAEVTRAVEVGRSLHQGGGEGMFELYVSEDVNWRVSRGPLATPEVGLIFRNGKFDGIGLGGEDAGELGKAVEAVFRPLMGRVMSGLEVAGLLRPFLSFRGGVRV